jgi:hypothetical protein
VKNRFFRNTVISATLVVIIILIAALAFSGNGRAAAAGGNIAQTTPPYGAATISLLAEDVTASIESPFLVGWGAVQFFSADVPSKEKTLTLFQGQRIASVPVTIKNRTAVLYGANFSVRPAKDTVWPATDIKVTAAGINYAHGAIPVVQPGKVLDVTVEIQISYGSPTIKFQGLLLDVTPAPPAPPQEKG